jgi:hypothetical protein
MTAITETQAPPASPAPSRVKLDEPLHIGAVIAYLAVILGALLFMARNINNDISRRAELRRRSGRSCSSALRC